MLREGAEERMARQLRLGGRRAREPTEEAGALARRAEGGWMVDDQLVEDRPIELDPRRDGWFRKAPGGSGQAKGAVAAGLGARLAEVADECLHLAAVVFDQGEDP